MQQQPKETNSSKKVWLSIVAIVLMVMLLILLFMCNRVVVFMQDDLWYSANLVNGEPIDSVADIIQSQIWHYFNWGGRSVAHSLLQLLLWLGDSVCNFLNTFVFAALSIFLAANAKKWNSWQTLLTAGALIAFNPNILDTLFWQSGTVNYLYMTMLSFPIAAMYLKSVRNLTVEDLKNKRISSKEAENTDDGSLKNSVKEPAAMLILKTVLLLFWGILSGWTNENIGPTLFLICLASTLIYVKVNKKILPWMVSGLTGLGAGSAVLILSPGNSVRNQDIVTLGSWKLDLCKRVVDYMQGAFASLLLVILFTLLCYILYRTVLKKMPPLSVMILLLAGIVSYLGLALSPHVPERSLFGTMCFFIWAGGSMFYDVTEEIQKERYRIAVSLLLFIAAFHKVFFLWAQGVGWYRYS